jgi:hypothetical protein
MNRNKRKITAPTAAFSQTAKLPEKEVILRIGAEGCSITLFGTSSQRGWLYNMSVDECLDDDRFQYESNVVDSWEAALTLLDQYPWHRLSPLKVHPEFRTQIWTAVQR